MQVTKLRPDYLGKIDGGEVNVLFFLQYLR